MMFKNFMVACLLGVLLKQVYAFRTEQVDCLKRLIKTELKLWQLRIAKTRTCDDLLQRVEEVYEYLEDCSIDGSVMEAMSSQVDEFCAPGSKIFKDLYSGTECWPKGYTSNLIECAITFILKLPADEESCPSFKPLIDCCADAANELCEGKSVKQINRFIDGFQDLLIRICNSIVETA